MGPGDTMEQGNSVTRGDVTMEQGDEGNVVEEDIEGESDLLIYRNATAIEDSDIKKAKVNVYKFNENNVPAWEKKISVAWFIHGVQFIDIKKWILKKDIKAQVPMTKLQDGSLLEYFIKCFEDTDYSAMTLEEQFGNSGVLLYRAILKEFAPGQGVRGRNAWAGLEEEVAYLPNEDMEQFRKWANSVSAKWQNVLGGLKQGARDTMEELFVSKVLKATSPKGAFGRLVADLSASPKLKWIEVIRKYRQTALSIEEAAGKEKTAVMALEAKTDTDGRKTHSGVCYAFKNTGKCGRGAECKFEHRVERCRRCLKMGHRAEVCDGQLATPEERAKVATKRSSNVFYYSNLRSYKNKNNKFNNKLATLDSGASITIVDNTQLKNKRPSRTTITGIGGKIQATGTGTSEIITKTITGREHHITVPALGVENYSHPLISLDQLINNGYTVDKQVTKLILPDQSDAIELRREKGTVVINTQTEVKALKGIHTKTKGNLVNYKLRNSKNISIQLAHKRLGHIGADHIRKVIQAIPKMRIEDSERTTTEETLQSDLITCLPCAEGKMKCKDVTRGPHRSIVSGVRQAAYGDWTGIKSPSAEGYKHCLLLRDAYTGSGKGGGMVRCFFTKEKNAETALEIIKQFRTWWHPIGCQSAGARIILDRDPVFTSSIFQQGIQELQWECKWAAEADEHALAGPIEIIVRHISEGASTLLKDTSWTEQEATQHWEYAMACAVYLHNIRPTSRGGKSPFHEMFGYQPDLNHLRRFGCLALRRNPHYSGKGRFTSKLDTPGIFLGYDTKASHGVYIIRLLDRRGTIVTSRSVFFLENVMPRLTDDPNEILRNIKIKKLENVILERTKKEKSQEESEQSDVIHESHETDTQASHMGAHQQESMGEEDTLDMADAIGTDFDGDT